MMKILFTSVGRRVELIQAYKDAANKTGIELQIIGADITETAPALQFCDEQLIVPRINDEKYIPSLIQFCDQNSIDALIPTIDTDLLLLAENRERFWKTRVVISDHDKIALCRDKRLTGLFFSQCGLQYPEIADDYKKYDLGFPAFIKPKDGSSSINAYTVKNSDELKTLAEMVPDYIVQPFIKGTEYTVDVFCDFEGNPIYITPRIRLAVRSGEVLKTKIDLDSTIIDETKALIKKFKPRGAITIQLIREDKTGVDYYIEINPRYGGGAPLSIKAGADSPVMMLRLLSGEKIGYQADSAINNAVYSRFDQSIRVQ